LGVRGVARWTRFVDAHQDALLVAARYTHGSRSARGVGAVDSPVAVVVDCVEAVFLADALTAAARFRICCVDGCVQNRGVGCGV
jgi:hypothetical protein